MSDAMGVTTPLALDAFFSRELGTRLQAIGYTELIEHPAKERQKFVDGLPSFFSQPQPVSIQKSAPDATIRLHAPQPRRVDLHALAQASTTRERASVPGASDDPVGRDTLRPGNGLAESQDSEEEKNPVITSDQPIENNASKSDENEVSSHNSAETAI